MLQIPFDIAFRSEVIFQGAGLEYRNHILIMVGNQLKQRFVLFIFSEIPGLDGLGGNIFGFAQKLFVAIQQIGIHLVKVNI
nr:hypothetical protein [uncultured bacterium]